MPLRQVAGAARVLRPRSRGIASALHRQWPEHRPGTQRQACREWGLRRGRHHPCNHRRRRTDPSALVAKEQPSRAPQRREAWRFGHAGASPHSRIDFHFRRVRSRHWSRRGWSEAMRSEPIRQRRCRWHRRTACRCRSRRRCSRCCPGQTGGVGLEKSRVDGARRARPELREDRVLQLNRVLGRIEVLDPIHVLHDQGRQRGVEAEDVVASAALKDIVAFSPPEYIGCAVAD